MRGNPRGTWTCQSRPGSHGAHSDACSSGLDAAAHREWRGTGTRQGLVSSGHGWTVWTRQTQVKGAAASPRPGARARPGRDDADGSWIRLPCGARRPEEEGSRVHRVCWNSVLRMRNCGNVEDGAGPDEQLGKPGAGGAAKRTRQGSEDKWPKTRSHGAANVKATCSQGWGSRARGGAGWGVLARLAGNGGLGPVCLREPPAPALAFPPFCLVKPPEPSRPGSHPSPSQPRLLSFGDLS